MRAPAHFCRAAAGQWDARDVTIDAGRPCASCGRTRWPGNVRQLQNFIERLVVLSDSLRIDEAALQAELDRPVQFTTDRSAVDAEVNVPSPAPAHTDSPLQERLARQQASPGEPDRNAPADVHLSAIVRDAERAALLRALDRSGNNRSDAARLLGVSRSTFYAKLKQYGLL